MTNHRLAPAQRPYSRPMARCLDFAKPPTTKAMFIDVRESRPSVLIEWAGVRLH